MVVRGHSRSSALDRVPPHAYLPLTNYAYIVCVFISPGSFIYKTKESTDCRTMLFA